MDDELTDETPVPIPPAEVQSPPAIPEAAAGVILTQEKDPLFIALQREKKRTKRLRALLTKNKNLSTSSTGDGASTSPGAGDEPVSGEGLPAPVLQSDGGKKQRDPITRALNFLGKGNKKRDGP